MGPTGVRHDSRKAIDTVIFDLGNVLVKDGHWHVFDKLGLPFSLKQDAVWQRYKVGALTEMEFWKECCRGSPLEGKEEETAESVREAYRCASPAGGFPFVEPLYRNGYQVAILSNHVSEWARPVVESLGLSRWCNPILISAEIKLAKPDTNAFWYALTSVGRASSPERCLFIDDKIENVRSAQACGMAAIHFVEKPDIARYPSPSLFLGNALRKYGVWFDECLGSDWGDGLSRGAY